MPKYDEDIELHPQKDARIPLWRCPNQPNKQIQAPPPTALIKSWAIELFSNNDEPRTSIMSWFFRWYQAQGQRALASWPHPEEVMTLCVTQADQGRTSDLWSHTSFSDKEHKIGSSSSISRQKSLKSRNKTWPWIRNLKFIYSEKATKFCEISTLLLSVCTIDKSKVEISQNFVAFSEYTNFIYFM